MSGFGKATSKSGRATLVADIGIERQEKLRALVAKEKKSIAEIVREALDLYFAGTEKKDKGGT